MRRFLSIAFTVLLFGPSFASAQPGQAALVSSADAGANTFTWNAVTGATYYYLWVNEGSTPKHQLWYTSAQAGCASGESTCRITVLLPNMNFVTSYWWIQTWSPAGYGPWSSPRSFAIRPPKPPILVDANDRYVGTYVNSTTALIDINGIPAQVQVQPRGFTAANVSLIYLTNNCTGQSYGPEGFDTFSLTSISGNGYLLRGPSASLTYLSYREALTSGGVGTCTPYTNTAFLSPINQVDLTSLFESFTAPFRVIR